MASSLQSKASKTRYGLKTYGDAGRHELTLLFEFRTGKMMRKLILISLCLLPSASYAQSGAAFKAMAKSVAAGLVAKPKVAPASGGDVQPITPANFNSAIKGLVARDGVVEMGEGEPRRYRIPLTVTGIRGRGMVNLPAKLQLAGYNETYLSCASFSAAGAEGKPVSVAVDEWALQTETVDVSNLVILAPQCRVVAAQAGMTSSKPAPVQASSERKCTPKADYAGIASYSDPKMERIATEPIRSFDQYVFKARRTLNTGKYPMLEGALYRFDGKVSPGSWVLADEWDCA